MSYANIFELTKSLSDCLEYCKENPEREHTRFHCSLLADAQEKLEKTTENANHEFVQWRMENREDMLAWKHLAGQLKGVQRKLDAVNAIGFIDQKVNYWDRPSLVGAVDEMIEYLRERVEVIDFAEKQADKLERQKQKALSEDDESERALEHYIQYAKLRSDGLVEAKETLANFRKALRRDLGTRHEDYNEIRWPQQVSPDEKVL